MYKLLVAISLAIFTTSCGTLNNALVGKTKIVEYYRIFDIKTNSERQSIAEAASNGLGRNVNDAKEATPIPSFSTPPDEPGRFELVNPFEGSKFAAFAAMSGGSIGFKIATCDGAVWTANAERGARVSDNLKITACLFQYKQGYHLNVYGTFMKKEGGLTQISRSMAHAAVGTPEEWTEKTFLDIVRNIRKVTGAEITFLEGQPKMGGTPWLDPYH